MFQNWLFFDLHRNPTKWAILRKLYPQISNHLESKKIFFLSFLIKIARYHGFNTKKCDLKLCILCCILRIHTVSFNWRIPNDTPHSKALGRRARFIILETEFSAGMIQILCARQVCVQNDIHEDLIHLIVDSKFVRIQCDCFDLSLNSDHYCNSI